LMLMLISCSCGQMETLSANEIWNRYLETFGHREEINKIKTFSVSTTDKTKYGQMPSKRFVRYPDKIHTEYLYPGDIKISYIFNGKNGIMKSSDTIRPMTEFELEAFMEEALIFQQLYYLDLGYSIELAGTAEIGDLKCYKLIIQSETGDPLIYYIDQVSFKKINASLGKTYFDHYEMIKIGEVYFDKKQEWSSDNVRYSRTYYDHKINPVINDSVFQID
jgi:outer membrane lipoprotein-sorting protein